MRTINLIVIHCSATRADRDFTEDDLEVCHRRRGFNGTGYHFYIRKNGDIKTTREIERIGAHAKGHNQNSIGICYEGGLDCHGHPADTRTVWQVHSMHVLILTLLRDYPGCRVDAQDFINHVNEAGGFCVSCHPFRNNNRGLEENLRAVKGLHGVEVLNGSTALEANRRAFSYCRELGLKTIGASDAHTMGQIGKYATWLPEKVDCLKDFVEQLKTRQVRPAVWNGSSYDVVDML